MKEWTEAGLDRELEELMQEVPVSEKLEERIIKNVNRRIRRIVIHTLLAIFAMLLVAILVINPIMNQVFFNPYKENEEPGQKMLGIMRDYFELTQPYRELISLEVTKKGFARYDLEMQVADLTEPIYIGAPNVWCEVNFGRYEKWIDSDDNMSINVGRFTYGNENQRETVEMIGELPKSAVLYLSVSDSQPKTMEELKNNGLELEWFQIYQPDVDFQGGMSAAPHAVYSGEDNRNDMTEEELLRKYQKQLENLLENPEVWNGFSLCDGRDIVYSDNTELQKTYEDAKKLTSLVSKNYCVYGKRDKVIRFLQENEMESIYIENVQLLGTGNF